MAIGNRTFYGVQPQPQGIGLPGVQADAGSVPDPQTQAMLLTRRGGQSVIGEAEIRKAQELLQTYKQGKAALEERVVQDELWYELRHWEAIGRRKDVGAQPQPSSAWLFNAITNKHADAMDNYPETIVLPRERSDEESAKTLSEILPVIMDACDFEKTYSRAWWEKLKHGTSVYGVFWNVEKENGLGDIDIREIDLLKIFWEPGITDIQKSRNLFIVELVDEDLLQEQYPQVKGKRFGGSIDVKQYQYDENIDTSGKAVVVDWYYKVRGADGRTVLHYVKFVGDVLLYASENDPQYAQTGFYDHGEYPVVFDTLFPEKGTPVGFGFVSICKDPQLYIDKLSANILEKSLIDTKQRYFAATSTNVNRDQLLDVAQPIVEVEGDMSDVRLREITNTPLSSVYLNVMQLKIDEMKETAANRDVSSGGVTGGVTSGVGISALQEAGSKVSRDMIKASYRSHTSISKLVIELIRQFYDVARTFRIVAPNGYDFVEFSGTQIAEQQIGSTPSGEVLVRKPVFDLKIKAQKSNPFSRLQQNDTAIQLYQLGFFNPEAAQQSLTALEMMEFEGADKVREKVAEGQTLLNIVQQQQQQIMEMQTLLAQVAGMAPPSQEQPQTGRKTVSRTRSGGSVRSVTPDPDTAYVRQLKQRAVPDVEAGGE